MPTKLLEYLVKQCTKEVLDQLIAEEKKIKGNPFQTDNKEKSGKPLKVKFGKETKFKAKVKKVNENEGEEPTGASPSTPSDQPADPTPEEPKQPEQKPEEPKPEEKPEETPTRIPKGAVILSPKDKSKLQPIKFQGRDESSVERTLHQVAVSTAGARTKVSLGAKRLAREVIANPNITVFFYLGKTDPESEEIFLMADKSLQIAKDDSVQPSDIQGTPVASGPSHNYPVGKWDEPAKETNPELKYADWGSRYQNRQITAKPRYGIDEPDTLSESSKKLIKKAVHQILDSR